MLKGASLAEGLALADDAADAMGADAIMIIGGERVFRETLPVAQTLHFTQVHASPAGDVLFPSFDRGQWRETGREGPIRGEKDEAAFTYLTLERA